MFVQSQSPQAGQFNSYIFYRNVEPKHLEKSQSPQAGQFNSYGQTLRQTMY